MRYLSLFSWIGWFELWIQQAYEKSMDVSSPTLSEQMMMDSSKRSALLEKKPMGTQQPHCVWFSEIDKYAKQIYLSHFPDHADLWDITKINTNELPDFDMLCGWFHCQAFSIAGKRKGFDDTRGTLFFEIARILRAKRPRLLWLENVKWLLSHDNWKTFSTIIATLDELGYDLQWQVLNSKNHWVPQNRERVFIIGHLRGTPRPEVFPFTESSGLPDPKLMERAPSISALTATDYKWPSKQRPNLVVPTIGTLRTHKDWEWFREMKDWICPTIPARAREDGSGQPILNSMWAIRRLTPIECERLQGFPDNWTNSVSDSQRYKCCGNAVTVNVIQDIAEALFFS